MGQTQIIRELTPLSEQDSLYIIERNKEAFDFPLHSHDEFELNYIENARGAQRIIGDSVDEIEEYEHILITGGTGAGKTTILQTILGSALKLGDREIDYDNRAQVASVCEEFTTLYARTDETHDARYATYQVPGGLIHHHLHQHIAGEEFAFTLTFLPGTHFNDLFGRH